MYRYPAPYLLAVMTVTLALTAPLAAQTCGEAVPKVIGGEPAEAADWPGLAVLRLRDANSEVSVALCGATALSPKWVLTAAHCLKPLISSDSPYRYALDLSLQIHEGDGGMRQLQNWELDVVPAANRFSEAAAGPGLGVKRIIVHESYEHFSTTGNDIALIELADETPWTGAIMTLSREAESDPVTGGTGSLVEVAGFGRTAWDVGARSVLVGNRYYVVSEDRLQSAAMPSIANDQCRLLHSEDDAAIGPNQLCAGTSGIDSCKGDSGSALTMCDADNTRYQVGIVSWGKTQCGGTDGRYAGVYTRVSAYYDWVLGHTGPLNVEPGAVPDAASRALAEVESLLGEMQTLLEGDARVGEMPLSAIRTDGTLIQGSGATRLRLGDKFAFRVTPPADGKLLLVEINPDLKVTQLFPNQFWSEGDEIVRGGQEVNVPVPHLHGFSAFEVQAPAGPHRVLALLLPPDFDLVEINRPYIGLEQPDPDGFAGTKASVTYLATLLTEVSDYIDSYSDAADRNFVAVPNFTMFAALGVFDVE
ncbi:trypsin-like serine protease [Paracoccus actinidiae]|uniref:trypsin-like serine protease n=1 Tax=Paracoccus actinidiae TaxID=3064531 RepID=UPI0027D29C38|nr:trypsin-like serine protease [Paracoccus sp. M09]